ncbi:MAG: MscL family protein [Patescibacteria group bacterium]|nr:MscL family protein [Patescibacteria group bacterium]
MTEQLKTSTDVKVTAQGDNVKIQTPPTAQHKSGLNVFVTRDLVQEPIEGFVGFLKEYAVVGLAVGFAVGSQAQQVVKQILASFIDPAFILVFGKALSVRTFTLHFRSHAANFGWGALLYAILNFVFVLAAIYIIIKVFKLDKLSKKKSKKKGNSK